MCLTLNLEKKRFAKWPGFFTDCNCLQGLNNTALQKIAETKIRKKFTPGSDPSTDFSFHANSVKKRSVESQQGLKVSITVGSRMRKQKRILRQKITDDEFLKIESRKKLEHLSSAFYYATVL